LSFYLPQSVWLDCPGVTPLPFAEYAAGMRANIVAFAGEGQTVELPMINVSIVSPQELDAETKTAICDYYAPDLDGSS